MKQIAFLLHVSGKRSFETSYCTTGNRAFDACCIENIIKKRDLDNLKSKYWNIYTEWTRATVR